MTATTDPSVTTSSPTTPGPPVPSIAARRLTVVAAVLAPLGALASTIAYIVGDEGFERGQAGGAILVWAAVGYGIAIPGLARLFERQSPAWFVSVTVFGVIGSIGTALYAFDGIHLSAFDSSIADLDTAVVPFALRIPGLFFPLALLALGVRLARGSVVPKAPAYLLAVGAAVFPISRIGDIPVLAVGCDLVVLVALVGIAHSLLAADRPSEA